MSTRTIPQGKSYQKINGDLMKKEIKEKYKTVTRFAEEIGCSTTCMHDSLNRGYMNKGYVIIACQLLKRPADYYNLTEEVVQDETPANDLQKLTASVERIESILTFIYNKLQTL